MNRREYISIGGAGAIAASAGCLDTVQGWADDLDDGSAGTVRRAEADTFETEAEEGDDVNVDIEVHEQGSGRAEAEIRDPDGDVLESERFGFSRQRRTITVTAPRDGTYSVTVDPGRDRDAELRVSIFTS